MVHKNVANLLVKLCYQWTQWVIHYNCTVMILGREYQTNVFNVKIGIDSVCIAFLWKTVKFAIISLPINDVNLLQNWNKTQLEKKKLISTYRPIINLGSLHVCNRNSTSIAYATLFMNRINTRKKSSMIHPLDMTTVTARSDTYGSIKLLLIHWF